MSLAVNNRPRARTALAEPQHSLTIHTDNQIHFLRPPKASSDLPEEVEQLIYGQIVLKLTKPKAIKRVTIKLKSVYSIYSKSRSQTGTLLERSLNLECRNEVFPAGETRFSFAFSVPSSAAPYEKTNVGKVWQYLEAKVKGSSLGASDVYGMLPVYFVVAPQSLESDNVSHGLDLHMDNFSEELGLLSVDVKTESLTVSGLLDFRVNFHSPATEFDIDCIKASICQKADLTFTADKRIGAIISEAERIPICQFDFRNKQDVQGNHEVTLYQPLSRYSKPSEPLHAVTLGTEASFATLVRLPSDEVLRPTTAAGTVAPIAFSHDLVVEIFYTLAEGRQRLMTVQKPINIGSCCCTTATVCLPVYEEKSDIKTSALCIPDRAANKGGCRCSSSITSLLEQAQRSGLISALTLEDFVGQRPTLKARQASAYSI